MRPPTVRKWWWWCSCGRAPATSLPPWPAASTRTSTSPRPRSMQWGAGSNPLPAQLDLHAAVLAGPYLDLALDRAVARAHDLDAVAAGGEPKRLDAAARSTQLAVDVH